MYTMPNKGGLGEHRSDRIWCFLAIKSDIWWQPLEWFSWESANQILCSLNNKGNSVTVAITATLYFFYMLVTMCPPLHTKLHSWT